MRQKLSGLALALLLIAAYVLDYFMPGTGQGAVYALAADPSTIVIGVIVVGGAVYLWYADGHVERKDNDQDDQS